MSGRRKKIEAAPNLKVGDYVMTGTAGITVPSDWMGGRVLWVGRDEVLVEHQAVTGINSWRVVTELHRVRCAGTIEHCHDVKREAEIIIAGLLEAMTRCEADLDDAKRAIWAALDGIADLAPTGAAR